MSTATMVSVIIPVLNAAVSLEECLRAVRRSAYGKYELIVVDDGSTDASPAVAERYADIVIRNPATRGEGIGRNRGAAAARGEILVFIDADVVVEPDALRRIADHFQRHPTVAALTGRLSARHPHDGFFSQYKNLYMHYIFGLLPERVNFLYGSIHAVRKNSFIEFGAFRLASDTAAGLEYAKRGREIAFLRDLEVVHLKRYGFRSFTRNDFEVSFAWARLFFGKGMFRQLFRNGSGFAHSPRWQLASLALAPLTAAAGIGALLLPGGRLPCAALLLGAGYLALNLRFFMFLFRTRGGVFALKGALVTLYDNIVMPAGILYGLLRVMTGEGTHEDR